MSLLLLLLGAEITAHALPQQLSQQGRLLDANGAAVIGQHDLTFRLYNDPLYGFPLWTETLATTFHNGYYSVILGSDSANPLDGTTLQTSPLYLELEIDSAGAMEPRQEIHAAPYARMSTTAENVEGGSVNAVEVSVGGSLIIDSTGSWVGPTIALNWSDLMGIPADILDGDHDTLATISCNAGQILGWNGTGWDCAADNALTEAEVEQFVTNGPLDLAAGSTMGGLDILTTADQGPSLADLSCQSGELPKYDAGLGWQCDIDMDTSDWNALANVPAGFSDGIDNQLSESDVEAYVTNGISAFDLSPGSTLNGETILASAGCSNGEFLSYQTATSSWECANLQGALDGDADGIMAWDDCDDSDPNANSKTNDGDCDGILKADDCNDSDPNSNTVAMDADCDGVITAEDCDDSNPNGLSNVGDSDCDGVNVNVDCDDTDSNVGDINLDADCDGVVFASDCDDANASLGAIAQDFDCDGVVDNIDCAPADPTVSQGTGASADCAAASCKSILDDGHSNGTGYYFIEPSGSNSAMNVYCDMDHDGGGWTLVWGSPNSPLLFDGADYFESGWSLSQTSMALNGNVNCDETAEGIEMSLNVALNPSQLYLKNVSWSGSGGGDSCVAYGGNDGLWVSGGGFATNNSSETLSFQQSDNFYATCSCGVPNYQQGYVSGGEIYVR